LVVVKNINYTWFSLYDLFVTLGGEGRTLEKKTDEREMEGKIVAQLEWIDLFFFHTTKSPSGRAQKMYWRRILEGLEKFSKSFPCYYNTLKIKNILTICISSQFSTKTLTNKVEDFSLIPTLPLSAKSLPSPPFQTPKQSLSI